MNADFNEADAVQAIAGWAAPFMKTLKTEASRNDVGRLLYEAIGAGTLSLDDATTAALEGDPYVDRALRQVSRDYLASGWIPPALCPFIDAVLDSEGPANFPKGRHAYNSRNRNAAIKVLVEQTKRQWGVSKMRGQSAPGREKPCACSLVAQALTLCGPPITEERIVEIVGAG
jgi:hypothetical protein